MKKRKRVVSIILVVILILTIQNFTGITAEAGVNFKYSTINVGDTVHVSGSATRYEKNYKFVLDRKTRITVSTKTYDIYWQWIKILDKNGNRLIDDGANNDAYWYKNEINNTYTLNMPITLNKGTYYLQVINNGNSDAAGFTFKVSLKAPYGISVSNTSFVMEAGDMATVRASVTGNTKGLSSRRVTYASIKPDVAKVSSKGKIKAVSSGVAVIRAKVGTVTKNIKVVVKPKRVTGLKTSSVNRTSFELTWNMQKNVTGYIVYAYDSDFGEYTRVKTIKGYANNVCFVNKISGISVKKGSTYRMKVCSYINTGSKIYYGAKSNLLTVKTKR